MAPEIKPGDRASENAPPTSKAPDVSAAEAALKAKLSRKRTKTGCLTCRRRRIKCGEERPVCKNCIKSKRHCEGYNQRVVFKQPAFDYQPVPNGGAHITFQATQSVGQRLPHQESHASVANPPDNGQQLHVQPVDQQYVTVFDYGRQQWVTVPQILPNHAPGPQGKSSATSFEHPQQHVHFPPHPLAAKPRGFYFPVQDQQPQQDLQGSSPIAPRTSIFSAETASLLRHDHIMAESLNLEPNAIHGQGPPPAILSADYITPSYDQQQAQAIVSQLQNPNTDSAPHNALQWSATQPPLAVSHNLYSNPVLMTPPSATLLTQVPAASAQHQNLWVPVTLEQHQDLYATQNQHPSMNSGSLWPGDQQNTAALESPVTAHATPEYYEHEAHESLSITPTQLLNSAAVEFQDDDYYDVHSDEDMDFDFLGAEQSGHDRQQILDQFLAMSHISAGDLYSRRYDTFIYDGILDTYRPEEVASPLKNPATARVFAHFIAVTGPSLSVNERHARNTSVLFTEGSVPMSQQGLWTYKMPMAALRNQGLLHAMLALASLHIAKLQNASQTPSMQHYAWALRRIHASVGKPGTRLKATTIAASLLLGFYEIVTADHVKWNMHLAGSKQLFVETNFVQMTKEFRRLKRERAARFHAGLAQPMGYEDDISGQDDLLDQIYDVDERVVSYITGKEVRYEDHGEVEMSRFRMPQALDIGKLEILKDLYWWYCKQDVIQSVISGNPLLMDFGRWANCPPRAPLGRSDAVYGSFDHLILLLGRIADFASRDRVRKLKQIEANGGQWRPAPGMNISRPPAPPPSSAPQGPPPTPQANQPAQPAFYGMAPPPRLNVQMPASYASGTSSLPTPNPSTVPIEADYDLAKETALALSEYDRIRAALHTFSISLGEAFEPLTSEYQMPLETSFGTAILYRSYDIGCVWALYNMAVIIAIRAHPHMPPASHVAAAVAAAETAPYANEIGRIAAGIMLPPPNQPLNPTLGSALCEVCLPSFFAAVQYQNTAQRFETVTRIYAIAKRTGWGSAELIANGCETAWIKAAAMGRGPPYERIVRPAEHSDDPRLNGSWEHLDPSLQPDETDDGDRRLIRLKANARMMWAIGVMGLEEDVEAAELNDM